jgi:hypothetical protein
MKYVRYLWYLLRHKWYVLLASWKYGCLWLGIVHDLSKFYPSEFFAYAEYFYGKWREAEEKDPSEHERMKLNFDLAWLYHQRRNPHHHQFWVQLKDDGIDDPMEMPEIYVREMLADWEGAGRAIHGRIETLEWYEKNWHKMLLHPLTRSMVEKLLGYPVMKKTADTMPPRTP